LSSSTHLTRQRNRSFRAEREFGLVVGGVLALLAGWWLYRDKFPALSLKVLAVGALLIVLGLLVPRSLVYPNKAWMLLAEALSYVSTRIILAVVFFLILTPIGLIKRAMGWDPLNRRAVPGDSYWRPYPQRQLNTKHYEKMF